MVRESAPSGSRRAFSMRSLKMTSSDSRGSGMTSPQSWASDRMTSAASFKRSRLVRSNSNRGSCFMAGFLSDLPVWGLGGAGGGGAVGLLGGDVVRELAEQVGQAGVGHEAREA